MCCKNTSEGGEIAHAICLFTHKLYGIKTSHVYTVLKKQNSKVIKKMKNEKWKRNKIIDA